MGMKFLHLPKSKQFKMVTRYYDPQKEAMRERQERINQELGLEQEQPISYGANIKGKFRQSGKHHSGKTLEEARRKSNMRLIYILIILCALFYFFLK
ncbi:MAG: hypothetical protein ACM3O8_04040 [Methylococcaceae bacterium]|nr:hypothetical protein [Prolixibacteraceae bacterium]